jgi:hypothetical protein
MLHPEIFGDSCVLEVAKFVRRHARQLIEAAGTRHQPITGCSYGSFERRSAQIEDTTSLLTAVLCFVPSFELKFSSFFRAYNFSVDGFANPRYLYLPLILDSGGFGPRLWLYKE